MVGQISLFGDNVLNSRWFGDHPKSLSARFQIPCFLRNIHIWLKMPFSDFPTCNLKWNNLFERIQAFPVNVIPDNNGRANRRNVAIFSNDCPEAVNIFYYNFLLASKSCALRLNFKMSPCPSSSFSNAIVYCSQYSAMLSESFRSSLLNLFNFVCRYFPGNFTFIFRI